MVGSASEFRARKLASEIPAVVVTTNYRLNVFGFLTLPPSGFDEPAAAAPPSSGNYGLLDQQAALGWVQRNIGRFGGDASRVTLAGHSSGGTSVCVHLASPPAWGSFSGAMIQSANCVSVERDVLEAGSVTFASALGCTDPASAASCLRALPTDSLVSGLGGFQAAFSVDPALLPVALPEAFTTGDIARVPTLLGTTHDELRIFLSALFPLAPARYPEMLESSFPGFGAELAELYPADAYADPLYAYSAALSDAVTNCPTRQTAAQLSRATATYYYEFDDPNAPAPHWMPVPPGFVMGSTHSSDAPYIFDRDGLVQPDAPPFDSAQLSLGRELRQAIGAFLRAGDPSLPAGPSWPAYEPETDLVMLMQPGGLNVTPAYEELHHCDFWASVPPPVL
jgi:para-nitrobenzyl esterase